MPKCLISIVTVSYNSEKTISDTILSVLNQTYSNIEYIIIDGASKDNTVKIAKSFSCDFAKKGIKYTVISEKDNGIYDAMNKGIKMSSGEVVGMINSDDWYELDALEKVARQYKKTKFDLLFGDLRIHKKHSTSVKHSKLSRIITSRHWNHPTTFIAKSVYNERLYDCDSLYDDFDMYIRLRKEKRKVVVINEILANFRMGGISSNEKKISKMWEKIKMRYKVYRKNGYSPLYFFECLLIESAKFVFYLKGAN